MRSRCALRMQIHIKKIKCNQHVLNVRMSMHVLACVGTSTRIPVQTCKGVLADTPSELRDIGPICRNSLGRTLHIDGMIYIHVTDRSMISIYQVGRLGASLYSDYDIVINIIIIVYYLLNNFSNEIKNKN